MDPPKFDIGISLQQAMAAFAGACSSVVIFPPRSKAWAFILISSGTLAAAYLAPLVMHFCHLEAASPMANAVVFLTGSFGMMVLGVVGKLIELLRSNPLQLLDWWAVLRGAPRRSPAPPPADDDEAKR